jgi:hypothetical protein
MKWWARAYSPVIPMCGDLNAGLQYFQRAHILRKSGKDIRRRMMKMGEELSGHKYDVSIVNNNEQDNQSLIPDMGRESVLFYHVQSSSGAYLVFCPRDSRDFCRGRGI